MFTFLFLNGIGMASNTDDIGSAVDTPFQIKARVMEISRFTNKIIIAENVFKLLYHYDATGKKVWDTHFLDKEGNPITLEQIKKRDKVLMHGTQKNKDTVALEIILLE